MTETQFKVLQKRLASVDINASVEYVKSNSSTKCYWAVINSERLKRYLTSAEARNYISRNFAFAAIKDLADVSVGNYVELNGKALLVTPEVIADVHKGCFAGNPIKIQGNETKLFRCLGMNGTNVVAVKQDAQLVWYDTHIGIFTGTEIYYLPHIKYFHQLQNIYRSLSGKELPFSSKRLQILSFRK